MSGDDERKSLNGRPPGERREPRGTAGGVAAAVMTDNIATMRSRGLLTIFALNKQALLHADPDVVPRIVAETIAGWSVTDRPVWVRVGPDPTAPGEQNDTYGFVAPVTIQAPKWWLMALDRWHEHQKGEPPSKVSDSGAA